MARYTYIPPMHSQHEENKEIIQMGIWAGVAIILIVAIVLYILMRA